jgi:membrane protein YqaA with SNARE-associated domain
MVAIGLVTFFLMSTRGQDGGYWYLLFYSIPSNTAISLFPHEPVLIYYGKFADLWLSAAAATAGTVIAGWLDHRVFVPVLNYRRITSYKQSRFYRASTKLFMRYPFATLLVTGFTPIPFWPFKFLCFSIHSGGAGHGALPSLCGAGVGGCRVRDTHLDTDRQRDRYLCTLWDTRDPQRLAPGAEAACGRGGTGG